MYDLYAYPDTYAMGCHLLLEESGAGYRIMDVSQFDLLAEPGKQHALSAFTQASPHQRVPALRLENGRSICESGAIALYLGDVVGQGRFSVPANSNDRPEYLQWLFYLSSTLQPEIMLQFHPEYYFESGAQQLELQTASQRRLDRIWSVVDKRYTDKCNADKHSTSNPWMFGEHPTAVDFSLAPVLFWPESFSGDIAEYPALENICTALKQRPACQRVIDWHKRRTDKTGNPLVSTSAKA